jgi:hypothetical protein
MKQIRFSIVALALLAGFAANDAQGQTSEQALTFSVVGTCQGNPVVTTRASTVTKSTAVLTNIISSAMLVKSIALDLANTNWIGGTLIRKVDLTSGASIIVIRKIFNKTTNEVDVTSFFSGGLISYLTNYAVGATNGNDFGFTTNTLQTNAVALATNAAFALSYLNVTNNNAGVTNLLFEVPNQPYSPSIAPNPIVGFTSLLAATNGSNNLITINGLYFMSFRSTNISFNLFGYAAGGVAPVIGRNGVNHYAFPVSTLNFTGIGTCSLNTNQLSGPATGSFAAGLGAFSTVP